jgi:hypothetical protein
MDIKELTQIIKESVKKQQLPYYQPLINYQPPGLPIIINPIFDNLSNTPMGPSPMAPGADQGGSK